ncbi:aminoglycoside phosphotransferase family protein [Methanofollis formosanus]|uniref:Aminoglycoside phosphotransferase family protein n=1 Tax=Methanofollis formosanus TaxID=299308 RepID=A0A8G1A2F1_9EURY|nr:phosphotransferase [Methanofollis formosanus]QYZ79134.1 aminoglycoside phosphotransferase family protein [Methanofollis formosanus]
MGSERYVATLTPGDLFRDWLVSLYDGRLRDPACRVKVSLIRPASHTVCRYTSEEGDLDVVVKFFAEPTGRNREYDPARAMKREYRMLKMAQKAQVPVAGPVAVNRTFNCALVTTYVPGTPLGTHIKNRSSLSSRLSAVAGVMRRLHARSSSSYEKTREFSTFHDVLDQVGLPDDDRDRFNRLLGEWWRSGDLDRRRGCMIHRDATPANYLFTEDGVTAIDFESAWTRAHPVHDLGILCAEMKNLFRKRYGDPGAAEPYVGHFLREYAGSTDEFEAITTAFPFFMAEGYLRTARLKVDDGDRRWLIREAERCLKRR